MVERYEEGIALSQDEQRHPNSKLFANLAEVSGLGLLGKENEAADALDRLQQIQPDISLCFIEQSIPIAKSDARDRFLHGLASAGMPR